MQADATRAKELAGLIERLEAATGPDRILDATIARDVAGLCLHGSWHSEGPDSDRGRVCDDCGADSWGNLGKFGQRLNGSIPEYTASIDAAVALVERMLPGWYIDLYWSASGSAACIKAPVGRDDEYWSKARQPAPLAILLALLRALQESQDAQ